MSEQEQELKIDIEAVKKMVADGKDRKEIAKELGITLKECREIVFQSPELKGIRKPQTRKERRKIVLVSGPTENATINATPLDKEAKKSVKKEVISAEKEEEEEADETLTITEETKDNSAEEKPSKVQW